MIRHSRPRRIAPMLVVLAMLGLVPIATVVRAEPAGAIPPGFVDTAVWDGATGLVAPSDLAFAPDGRIFLAERSGLVYEFDGPADPSPKTFADLRTQVFNAGDKGLLGLTVDPQFPTRPYLYALYSLDAPPGRAAPYWNDVCPSPPGINDDGCTTTARLSRLTWSPGGLAGPERILIEDWCHQGSSHAIGTVTFGTDGALYVGSGEGASVTYADWGQRGIPPNPCGDPPGGAGVALSLPTAEGGALRAQDLRTPGDPVTLDGAILRIDPDTGAGLPDNPYAGSADPNARRIVAYGARNPFRFEFRPGTDEIYVGDVGWAKQEEINLVADVDDPTVENFGWPCYEGNAKQGTWDSLNANVCETLYASPGAVSAPWFTYSHTGTVAPGDTCPVGAGAVTGLAFSPSAYPAPYDDALFFVDYARSCLYSMAAGASGRPDPATRQLFAPTVAGSVDLEVSPAGELWYVTLSEDCPCVRRIAYTAGNTPPTAVIRTDRTAGPVPLAVQLEGTGSFDLDPGQVLTYDWDLDGDGQYDDATGPTATRTYPSVGVVTARLRVTDPLGATGTASVQLTPGESPPTVTMSSPAAGTTFAVGQTISLAGSATDARDGALGSSALDWVVAIEHCSETVPDLCHEHLLYAFDGTAATTFAAPDHEYPSHLEVRLTATDSAGLRTTVERRLDPRVVDLTLTGDPPGAILGAGSTTSFTPFVKRAIVGSNVTITAPYAQLYPSGAKVFRGWSDYGDATHTITAPAAPTTYTAYYGDRPLLTPPIQVVDEGTGGTRTVNLQVKMSSPSSAPVTLQYQTYDLMAAAPSDYVAASGTLTFSPGQTVLTLPITVKSDAMDEADEFLLVQFSNGSGVDIGGYFGLGAILVRDDDNPPAIQGGVGSIIEGDAGTKTLNVPVLLGAQSGKPVSVSWTTVAGTALAGLDYTTASGTLTIPAGQIVGYAPVSIVGDVVREDNEILNVFLSAPVNATLPPPGRAYGVITNDDEPTRPMMPRPAVGV